MSRLSLVQRFRFAVDDVGRVLRFVFRPWIELRAVKTTQVDVVNVVNACQADIADALASVTALSRRLDQLDGRVAEHDANILRLLDAIGKAPRAPALGSAQDHGEQT